MNKVLINKLNVLIITLLTWVPPALCFAMICCLISMSTSVEIAAFHVVTVLTAPILIFMIERHFYSLLEEEEKEE